MVADLWHNISTPFLLQMLLPDHVTTQQQPGNPFRIIGGKHLAGFAARRCPVSGVPALVIKASMQRTVQHVQGAIGHRGGGAERGAGCGALSGVQGMRAENGVHYVLYSIHSSRDELLNAIQVGWGGGREQQAHQGGVQLAAVSTALLTCSGA